MPLPEPEGVVGVMFGAVVVVVTDEKRGRNAVDGGGSVVSNADVEDDVEVDEDEDEDVEEEEDQ